MRGVVADRVGVLVYIDIASITLGGSTLLDTVHGVCLARFGRMTRLASGFAGLLSRIGFGGPASTGGGNRGSTGASIHSHDDDEGGLFGIMEVVLVIWKANDVCRKLASG